MPGCLADSNKSKNT